MASGLDWNLLKTRRENIIIVKFVKNCLDGQAPGYLSDYSQQQTYDVHVYCTRSKDKYLLIKSIPNRLCKRAFFYKELPL